MNLLKRYLHNTILFFLDTAKYLRDALAIHILVVFLVIPLLLRFLRFIACSNDLQFMSLTSLINKPLACLELFFCLILLFLTVYFEFIFLLISMYFIRKKMRIKLFTLLRSTLLEFKKLRLSVFFFFFFYFFLILPIAGLATHLDIISNLKIPAFIMDFIFANRYLFVSSLALIYLFCLYLGFRFIFVMPELIFHNQKLIPAVKRSLLISKGHFWGLLFQFLGILVTITAGFWLIVFFMVSLEQFFESAFPDYALVSGSVIMGFLQIASILNFVLSMVMMNYVALDYLEEERLLPQIPQWFDQPHQDFTFVHNLLVSIFIGVSFFLGGVILGMYNRHYLANNILSTPKIYSHRGVDQRKSVQNTLSALKKIVKIKPDYIEIDLQETKDHYLVLMHDENLQALAGINKTIAELNLAEIKKLKLRENGNVATIPTFDEYLEFANYHHQKLMIELKFFGKSAKQQVNRFVSKYADNILKNGHRVQSLSLPIIEEVKRLNAKIYTSYIMPFNFIGPPQINANAYTMEYSTLNASFVNEAHRLGKAVFAWTVNSKRNMLRMRSIQVDGIITDQASDCLAELKTDRNKIPYSEKLLIYVWGLDSI